MHTSYLHIRCDEFAFLTATQSIVEIIQLTPSADLTEIMWRNTRLSVYNLTKILLPDQKQIVNHNALIIKNSAEECVAIAVESVASIESIDANSFHAIPSIQFRLKQFFDKVYINPSDNQCIYRLKIDSFTSD